MIFPQHFYLIIIVWLVILMTFTDAAQVGVFVSRAYICLHQLSVVIPALTAIVFSCLFVIVSHQLNKNRFSSRHSRILNSVAHEHSTRFQYFRTGIQRCLIVVLPMHPRIGI